jgi:ketosteroid isomerase-like protein
MTQKELGSVEIARRGFETYNRYGIRAVAEQHWHPEVEWHVGPWAVALGGQAEFHGREAGIAAFDELEALTGQFRADVLDAEEGPKGVFVAVRLHRKGAGSGAPVEQHFWYAIEMEGRWERRIRVCGDPLEALEAAGFCE